MTMSKADYEQLLESAGGTVILTFDDSVSALEFTFDVLCAEADALKKKAPYAIRTISRLEDAAKEVYDLLRDVDNEEFSEEEAE